MAVSPATVTGRPRSLLPVGLLACAVFLLVATGLWWFLPTKPRQTVHLGQKSTLVGFSPDGKLVAVVASPMGRTGRPPQPEPRGPLRLWDVQTGQERPALAADWPLIRKVLFSPDGKLVATVSDDGDCTVWDTASGQSRLTVKTARDNTRGLTSARGIRFAPDGQTLAVVSADGKDLELWDLSGPTDTTNSIIAENRGLRATIRNLGPTNGALRGGFAFSPDGKTLAVREQATGPAPAWQVLLTALSAIGGPSLGGGRGVSAPGLVLRLRDARTGATLRTLPGTLGPGRLVAFSPNGQEVATDTNDGTARGGPTAIRRWDVATGAERPAVLIISASPVSIPADTLEYTGDGKGLRLDYPALSVLWDLGPTPPRLLAQGELAVSPDGTLAAIGDVRQVRLLELPSMKERHTVGEGYGAARPLAFAADGRTFAATLIDSDVESVKVGFFDVESGRSLGTTAALPLRVTFSKTSDGKFGMYGNGDLIQVPRAPLNVPKEQVVGTPPFRIFDALASDGKSAVYAEEEAIQLWDVPPRRNWVLIAVVPLLPAALVVAIALRRRRSTGYVYPA
jgi:WD40 repeat protein